MKHNIFVNQYIGSLTYLIHSYSPYSQVHMYMCNYLLSLYIYHRFDMEKLNIRLYLKYDIKKYV